MILFHRLEADSFVTLLPRRDVNLSAVKTTTSIHSGNVGNALRHFYTKNNVVLAFCGGKKSSQLYNLHHDNIKCVITYLKSEALLSLSCGAALRVIEILWLKLLLHWAHQGSSRSYTALCFEWEWWVNVISQYMWWNMLKCTKLATKILRRDCFLKL